MDHPLLERLNFLKIFSSNLDEFFEIRVCGFYEQLDLKMLTTAPDSIPNEIILQEISDKAHHAVETQYDILNQQILPQLQQHGIRVLFNIMIF